MNEFTPIEMGKSLGVTNRTIINRMAKLVNNGFIVLVLVNERVSVYKITNYTKDNKDEIIRLI